MNLRYFVAILLPLFLISCSSDEGAENPEEIVTFDLSGKAQKGPYLVGAEVTLSELEDDLSPTGRVFFARTTDNLGTFRFPELELASNLVEVRVEGNYFDEATGESTDESTTLTALADISDNEVINVNLLSQLEDTRVRLQMLDGVSFSEAKANSFSDLSAAFGFNANSELVTDDLDLTVNQEGSDLLFAVSTIVSGVRSLDENISWLQFLADFQADFGDDGMINNERVTSLLYWSAFNVNRRATIIRQDIAAAFDDFVIPDFEPVVDQYLEQVPDEGTYEQIFPELVDGQLNLLNLQDGAVLEPDASYVIAINPIMGQLEYILRAEINYELAVDGLIEDEDELWSSVLNFGVISKTAVLSTQGGNQVTGPIVIPISFSGKGELTMSRDVFIGQFFSANNYQDDREQHPRISWDFE